MTEVFINECSLEEQFHQYNFIEAIKAFLKTISVFNQINEKTIYKSALFFDFKAIKGTYIDTSLKNNFELNSLFSQNLKNASNWQLNKIHEENSEYMYNGRNYVKSSIAEIAERKIRNPDHKNVLLNFIESKFSEFQFIEVQKNRSIDVHVNCVCDLTTVHQWFITNGFIDPKKDYDVNLGLPPLDEQTVLLTSGKFELTKWRNGKFGRKVYKLIGSNELWVVDGSLRHASKKAHIEIFNENTKKHLGTSIHNKINLDSSFIKKDRTINLL